MLTGSFKDIRLSSAAAIMLGFAVMTACAAQPFSEAEVEASQAIPPTERDRPNILLIAIDDLRPDIGAYGHPTAITPNLDKLAMEAVLFERAYTQQAVCAPSRAALMTGLRPETTGIQNLKQPLDEVVPDVITLADFFRLRGYETLSIGKIYHHKDDDADGFTYGPENVVYDIRRARRITGEPHVSHKRVDDPSDLPDLLNVETAKEQLQRLAEEDKPFFMAFGIHKPHLPFFAPREVWEQYGDEDIPEPVSRERQATAPDYAVVAWEIWNYDDTPENPDKTEIVMPEPIADELRKGYLAAVTHADNVVGEILSELDRLGLDDETIVVIWGDHGFKLGDYNAWAKHSNLEMDIHIPLIIRVPGQVEGGARSAALVETVDIYPTLAELAGYDIPRDLDGLSMRPLLQNPSEPWKIAAFAQYDRGANKGRTVRTKDFRYTAWLNRGTLVAQELYDHRSDPNELVNVASDPEYADVLESHEALRLAGWTAVRAEVTTQ